MMFKKRNYDVDLVPAKGSQWWALPVEAIQELLACLEKNPKLMDFHKDSFASDEMVINTLLRKISGKESMDDCPIFVIRKLDNKKRRGVFTIADEEILLRAKERCLFARKFDTSGDSQILDLIDQHADYGTMKEHDNASNTALNW